MCISCNSEFSHFSFIWMFTLKDCNKRIDRIHEKSLAEILNDYESSFYDMISTLTRKQFTNAVHQRFIIEVYKYLNDLSPELMNEVLFAPKPL